MALTLFLLSLKSGTLTFAALFPIVNPFGAAPIFLGLTRAYPESIRRLLARRIALYGFLILGGSLAIGSSVLAGFGISLPIVQVAGGLVLANTGWQMLKQMPSEGAAGECGPGTVALALQQAFYPLTMPLTIGPGCISVCIAFGAHIRQQSNIAHLNYIGPFLGGLAGMSAGFLLHGSWLCYAHAGKLAAMLGPSGTNIVVRLSAFLLLAMGVQIIWNGASSLVTSLLTPLLTQGVTQ